MTIQIRLLLFIGFILLSLIIALGIMVAPGRYTKEMARPFKNKYFAHRGLHDESEGIFENTIPAFEAACQAGYGMELDVRLSRDGQVVVIHDNELDRMCGVENTVDNMDYDDLAKLNVGESDSHIPLFTEALECIDGRVPIIVEIKPCKNNLVLSKKTMEILSSYKGDYCVESFDPSIVKWLRNNYPHILRGQLANPEKFYAPEVPSLGKFFMANCLFGMVTRPHFIAYMVGPKPFPLYIAKLLGAMQVVWTSRPNETGDIPKNDARGNDVVIFEGYRPPLNIR